MLHAFSTLFFSTQKMTKERRTDIFVMTEFPSLQKIRKYTTYIVVLHCTLPYTMICVLYAQHHSYLLNLLCFLFRHLVSLLAASEALFSADFSERWLIQIQPRVRRTMSSGGPISRRRRRRGESEEWYNCDEFAKLKCVLLLWRGEIDRGKFRNVLPFFSLSWCGAV